MRRKEGKRMNLQVQKQFDLAMYKAQKQCSTHADAVDASRLYKDLQSIHHGDPCVLKAEFERMR